MHRKLKKCRVLCRSCRTSEVFPTHELCRSRSCHEIASGPWAAKLTIGSLSWAQDSVFRNYFQNQLLKHWIKLFGMISKTSRGIYSYDRTISTERYPLKTLRVRYLGRWLENFDILKHWTSCSADIRTRPTWPLPNKFFTSIQFALGFTWKIHYWASQILYIDLS